MPLMHSTLSMDRPSSWSTLLSFVSLLILSSVCHLLFKNKFPTFRPRCWSFRWLVPVRGLRPDLHPWVERQRIRICPPPSTDPALWWGGLGRFWGHVQWHPGQEAKDVNIYVTHRLYLLSDNKHVITKLKWRTDNLNILLGCITQPTRVADCLSSCFTIFRDSWNAHECPV